MKRIILTSEEKNKLLEETGVARSTMLAALKGERKTALANLIRKRAIELIRIRELPTI